MHYVEVMKEIIDVSYGRLRLMVMRCSWIPINTHGNLQPWNKMNWIVDGEPWSKNAYTCGVLCVSINSLLGELLISIESNWINNKMPYICTNQPNVQYDLEHRHNTLVQYWEFQSWNTIVVVKQVVMGNLVIHIHLYDFSGWVE